jgi:hypothetical protein
MTAAIEKFFVIRDACAAAGGPLTELAIAMDDAVVSGMSIECAIGLFGRWRIEGRQVLARRRAGAAISTSKPRLGDYSACARKLHAQLMDYAAGDYAPDRAKGTANEKNAELFRILEDAHGKIPALRSLRRRFS